jgi:hypothetical protein
MQHTFCKKAYLKKYKTEKWRLAGRRCPKIAPKEHMVE